MPHADAPASTDSRSRRLKAATHATHDILDKRIMAEDIFSGRDRFARFLRVQYRFHRDIQALYARADLAALLPDLAQRRRLEQIAADLADLKQSPPPETATALAADVPLEAALGWLYVAEGSNLGGAVLFKLASQKLGLDAGFGARHLAAHPDGAAKHWRQFTAALDGVALSPTQEAAVVQAAEDAFRTVHGYVAEEFA